MDNEKEKIAEYVYLEYEELRREFGDLELDLLKSMKVNTASGRFDMVFLATLFSAWTMKEERAFSIWMNLTEAFQDANTSFYSYLIDAKESQLIDLTKRFRVPPKTVSYIAKTAKNLRLYNDDINGLIDEKSWILTLKNIKKKCKGVNQKAFWIARIMRQKGVWDVPGRYCCVSDSHNKGFLLRTGFIKSDENLFHNSLVMWKYFNEPFETQWYDLPVFRFARLRGCSKCPKQICNFSQLSTCGT
ncbi:hypothetical protein ISS39_05845 [Candidatus Bathyarchaeota archaeon]|nr:hypothetical protein [Candidatus Bathyarchaeota archaeon]